MESDSREVVTVVDLKDHEEEIIESDAGVTEKDEIVGAELVQEASVTLE